MRDEYPKPSPRTLKPALSLRKGEGVADIKPMRYSPPKKCVFCGDTRLTGEHLWSNWLRKYLPAEKMSARGFKALSTVSHLGRVEGGVIKRPGDPHHTKIRCVCGGDRDTCNNGWMRKLEEAVEPILAPLLLGGETRLNQKQQEVLAGWVALKAVIGEYDPVTNAQRISTYAERQHIRRTSTAPARGWRIEIGHYKRQEWRGHWVSAPLSIVDKIGKGAGRATRYNSQSLVFVVGEVFMLVIRSPLPGLVERFRFGDPGEKLRRIWPSTQFSIRWPLPTLSDDDAARLSGALHNYSLRAARARMVGSFTR